MHGAQSHSRNTEPDIAESEDGNSTNGSMDLIENVEPPLSKNGIVRRTKLPAVAMSTENISIMGLLRNNVGKDLSTGNK